MSKLTKYIKRVFWTIGGILSVIALLVLIGVFILFGPYVYNYHLSPLARLQNKIHTGQSFEEVRKLCEEYYQKYRDKAEVYISQGFTSDLSAKPEGIPNGKYIHLYHWVFMDDLQLYVYFGPDSKVVHVYFLGD